MRHIIAAAGAVLVVVVAACSDTVGAPTSSLQPGSVALAKEPKVTVCHAAGRAGTIKYVAIDVSAHGANEHFRDNGTPRAGHELDFIATKERPCNAEPVRKAELRVCKLSSGINPDNANRDAKFHFRTSDGHEFTLHFFECTNPIEVDPGEITVTEAHDPNAPNAFSYYATSVVVTNGVLRSSAGFSGPRPKTVKDAIASLITTSRQLTTVTFYNRN